MISRVRRRFDFLSADYSKALIPAPPPVRYELFYIIVIKIKLINVYRFKGL
jgi:hypothetical protein